jgi:type IV pilus assembly protein PilM
MMRWLASPPPDAAIQIAPSAVSVTVLGNRGSEPIVQGFAIEPLPAGAVTASLTGPNVIARPAVIDALRRALDRLGSRPRRVALVIPDTSARVSLVRFDRIPDRREDLEQLVRWQIRKAAPFPIEEGCLTISPGARSADGGGEFVVVLARRDTVREYESLCEELGMHAGLVDLATLSTLNLFLAAATAPQGDWLVVYVQPEYTSIVILRGADVIFFRNKPEGEEEGLADLVHQTTMYYQDRLAGQGYAHAVLGGMGRTPGALDQARRTIEERLGIATEPIDPTQAATMTDRIMATPDITATLTPLVGILLRTRAAAVTA